MVLKAIHPIRFGKRIGILAIGLSANAAMAWGYDFVVYPYLLVTYGLWGWVYAVLGSIGLCVLTLWFYDLTRQDWLGVEALKLVRDTPARGRIRRWFHTLASRGDMAAFFLLSLRYDPFITTIYMRRGSGNYAMSARDWKVFWASVAVANGWWGIVVFGVIGAFTKWVMPILPHTMLHLFGLS